MNVLILTGKSISLLCLCAALAFPQGSGSGSQGGNPNPGSGGGQGAGTNPGTTPPGPNTPTPAPGRVSYDPSAVLTIDGVVTAVNIYQHELEYPSIAVSTTTLGEVVIKLAPLWFLLENDFEIQAGDTVRILALPCNLVSPATYYAVSISVIDPVTQEVVSSIILRDTSGFPLWTARGQTATTATPATGARKCAAQGNCLEVMAIGQVSGVVDSVIPGTGISQSRLMLRLQDGKYFGVDIGPARNMLGQDFELRAGETVMLRFGMLRRSRHHVALQLGYGNGYQITVRKETGAPAWF